MQLNIAPHLLGTGNIQELSTRPMKFEKYLMIGKEMKQQDYV
jgi:hypothetical protein